MQKIGLCLSGGVARGIAHIGVLQALEEYNIYPSHLSGASMGAVVAALYAAGNKPKDILRIATRISVYKLFKFNWPSMVKGDMELLRQILSEYIEVDSFESLQKPLYISVSNLNKGNYEIWSSGSLFDAIITSSSIPVIFPTMQVKGDVYVDGGLMNNLPIEPLKKHCDVVLGVNVNPHYPEDETYNDYKSLIQRCSDVLLWQNTRHRIAMCDVAIEVEGIEKYSPWGFNEYEKMFELGYESTLRRIHLIQEKIEAIKEIV